MATVWLGLPADFLIGTDGRVLALKYGTDALIFAANGPKPELVLADALNNDIRITKHGDFCLVYDLPIGIEGLRWQELVQWWAGRSPSDDPERSLYRVPTRLV